MTVRVPTGQDLACLICGASDELDIDHVVNRGMGGSKARDVPENKAPLCRGCHLAKTVGTVKTSVKDGMYYWRKRDSNLVFRVPVQLSKRYECLVATGEGDRRGSVAALVTGSVSLSPVDGEGATLSRLESPSQSSPSISAGERQAVAISLGPERDSNQSTNLRSPALSLEDWCEYGRCLRDEGQHLRGLATDWAFRVGDWIVHGEDRFGEDAQQFLDELGLTYWQVSKYASVARRIPPEDRILTRDNALETYRIAAQLEPPQRRLALAVAEVRGITAGQLKRAIQAAEPVETHACPSCGNEHRVRTWIPA